MATKHDKNYIVRGKHIGVSAANTALTSAQLASLPELLMQYKTAYDPKENVYLGSVLHWGERVGGEHQVALYCNEELDMLICGHPSTNPISASVTSEEHSRLNSQRREPRPYQGPNVDGESQVARVGVELVEESDLVLVFPASLSQSWPKAGAGPEAFVAREARTSATPLIIVEPDGSQTKYNA